MPSARGTGVLGAALAFAGIAFGSPSLIVPGFALLGLALAAVAWVELSARGAAITAAAGPARIVEGDAYPLVVELRRGVVPPPGGEIRDALLDRPVRIGPLKPARVELEIRMPRRGRHVLAGTEWEIRDPLGLRSRSLRTPPSGELLVLPRIEAVEILVSAAVDGEGAGMASAGEEGAASVREARAVEFEVDGLRPYRHGSPASRIHWPAVARSGEMHERRIVAGAEASPLVALDAEYAASEEALDRAVRAAASLCVHLASSTGCAVLLPGSHGPTMLDPRLRTWPALHSRFALVRPGAPTLLPNRLSALRGSIFWVTARAPDAVALPRSAGPGRHYVVSAHDVSGPAAFRVAGCTGVAHASRVNVRRRVAA